MQLAGELAAMRLLVHDHGTREVKDAISRELLQALEEAGVGIASSTTEIVCVPPRKVESPAVPAVPGDPRHSG